MQKKGSAAKRHRQSLKRRQRNRSVKTRVRTSIRSFEAAVEKNDKAVAEQQFRRFVSEIDTAVSKGVLHRNTAARKKSRLSKALTALS